MLRQLLHSVKSLIQEMDNDSIFPVAWDIFLLPYHVAQTCQLQQLVLDAVHN